MQNAGFEIRARQTRSTRRYMLVLVLAVLVDVLSGCGGSADGPNPPPAAFNPTAIGYVAVTKGDSVTSFLLDEKTGAMVHAATVSTGKFTIGPVVTPDRRFLFVSNGEDGTISRLGLDANGSMQSLGMPIAIGTGEVPWILAIAPSGRFLYAGTTGAAIAAFNIDAQTGDLTPLPGSPFRVASAAYGITLSHDGNFLYALAESSDAIYVFAVDPATGSLSIVDTAHVGIAPCAVVVHPTNSYLLVNSCTGRLLVFKITASGAIEPTPITDVLSAVSPATIAVAPSGHFVYVDDPYGRGIGGGGLIDNGILGFSFDGVSGAVTAMPGSPFLDAQSPSSVAVSPQGNILVSTRMNPGHVASYRIDQQTGALTPISGNLSESGIATGDSPNRVLLVAR